MLETADGKDVKCRFRAVAGKDTKVQKISHLKIMNHDIHERQRIVDMIIQKIRGAEENRNLYEVFALYYSEIAISRAL